MQDNQWDEQFVDHGWKEMRKLLDRDMPVLPWWRRRKAGWLALLLILGLGTGAVYLLNQYGVTNRTTPVSTIEDSPVASAPSAGEEKITTEEEVMTGIGPDRPVTSEESKGTVTPSPAQSSPKTSEPISAGTTADRELSSESQLLVVETEDELESESPRRRGQGSVFASEREKERGDKISEGHSRQIVAGLKPLGILPPDSMPRDPFALPEQEVLRRKDAFFLMPDQIGIEGNLLSSREGFGSGVGLGVTGAYRFGNSRWSLHTGLAYIFQQRDFYRPGSRGKSYDEVASPSRPQDEEDFGFNQATLPPSGSLGARTHRLAVPLEVEFRIGRRWGISTGMTAGYIISARQKSDYRPNVGFAGRFDQQTYPLLTASADERIDEELLRNWEFGITGGLSYRPHQRFILQLQYHHGLTDFVRSNYFESYNRNLGLGLVYLLK